jgi:UDP-glucose 4-epimerase
MDINGASILVTGGCGLIGSATIDLLLRDHAPARIVVLDNLERGLLANIEHALKDRRVSVVKGDIRDARLVNDVTSEVDAVIHMAALRITACAADPRAALEVMCDGTFNVVDAARRANVRKIIAASSASIYGMADVFPTPETQHPYNNETWYGACKTMLEGLLKSYHAMFGLPYVALRYFNVYGPRMDIHGRYTEVLVRWIDRIAAGQPPMILGDGNQTMDFIYIDDVARANVLALASDVTDDAINIASGCETSLLELAHALLAAMNSDLRPVFADERSVNPVRRRLADTSKARRLLGFHPEISLREGLKRLTDWWQRQAVRIESAA